MRQMQHLRSIYIVVLIAELLQSRHGKFELHVQAVQQNLTYGNH